MNTARPQLTISIEATAPITAHRFVSALGAPAQDDGNAIGVSVNDAAVGELCNVIVLGTALVQATSVIPLGGAVAASDGDGSAGQAFIGAVPVARALQEHTGVAMPIEVALIPN